MRPSKFLIVSATMLASTTLASLSFADNTTSSAQLPPSAPPTTGTGTSVTGSSSSSTTTTMPSTMTTTQGTPGAIAPSTPTSTTTTTSADDVSASSATSTPLPRTEPRESVTVYERHRPNKAYLITGLSILGGTYATTAAFSAANGPVGDKDLYIPIAGPWINLANRTCSGACDNTDTRDTALIVGSGVLQGVGAGLAIASFFIPEKTPVARINAGPVKMNISPTASTGGGGLGAIGTF
jgi:hypothetical protein